MLYQLSYLAAVSQCSGGVCAVSFEWRPEAGCAGREAKLECSDAET